MSCGVCGTYQAGGCASRDCPHRPKDRPMRDEMDEMQKAVAEAEAHVALDNIAPVARRFAAKLQEIIDNAPDGVTQAWIDLRDLPPFILAVECASVLADIAVRHYNAERNRRIDAGEPLDNDPNPESPNA